MGRSADDLIGPEQLPDQHLFKNKNRYHSRIINIEYEVRSSPGLLGRNRLREGGKESCCPQLWTPCSGFPAAAPLHL